MRKSFVGYDRRSGSDRGRRLGRGPAAMEDSPGRKAEPRVRRNASRAARCTNASPGAMQGPAEGQSTAIGEQGQRSGQSGTMQGQTQGRSSTTEENERRSGHRAPCKAKSRGGPAPSRKTSVALAVAAPCKARPRSGPDDQSGPPH